MRDEGDKGGGSTRNPCTRGLRGEVRTRSVVRALVFLRKRGRKWRIMVSREFCDRKPLCLFAIELISVKLYELI